MTDEELRRQLDARSVPIPFCGCVVWLGTIKPKGYGAIRTGKRSPENVHRLAYRLAKGPIPAGYQIDHLCRVRACINPNHMEAVTNRENTIRGMRPTLSSIERITHCRNGHEYTPENTMRIGRKKNRRCRICAYASRNKSCGRTPGDLTKQINSVIARRFRNAERKVCKHGHELTPDNVYVDPKGLRRCRACLRAAGLRYIRRLSPLQPRTP